MQQDPRMIIMIAGALGLATGISLGVAFGNFFLIPLGFIFGVLIGFGTVMNAL
jgi:hypothetical protein